MEDQRPPMGWTGHDLSIHNAVEISQLKIEIRDVRKDYIHLKRDTGRRLTKLEKRITLHRGDWIQILIGIGGLVMAMRTSLPWDRIGAMIAGIGGH